MPEIQNSVRSQPSFPIIYRMKISLPVPTSHAFELVPLLPQIRKQVRDSGIREGNCTIFCPHTTAGLVINENADPDVVSDLIAAFRALIPPLDYRHAEGNSPSHLLSCLTQPSLHLLVEDGEIQLGRWQGVFFCEFDGPRRREIWIKVTPD